MPTASVQGSPLRAFINEIHYDNAGTDAGEAIEVAGLAGTDLTGWSLVLYNGNGGASYRTTALSGLIPDQDDGFGTLAFTYPVDGIQNGSPDGVALVDETGAVVQFLSYEGSFTAVGGPANGLTSTDIGVVETASTPVGFSLQLTGQGTGAASFTWAPAPADDSFGAVNAGQDFTGGGTGPGSFSVADASVGEGNAGTSELVFTVTRSGGSTGTASVAYSVQAGTAAADDVAGLPSGTLTFADGETSQTVVVQVQGDAAAEPDETVTLELSGATGGATIADGSATGTITNDDRALVSIMEIQGAGQRSALAGEEVATSGIVTAVDSNGFYLQDPTGDGDAATSDAVFVFTGSKPLVARGDAVVVTGTVDEFTPGGASTGNLSTTQIRAPQVQVVSSGNALPQAVLIGPDGRTPPTEIIDDDGLASYDPATDGIDFFESLEGMLVTVQDPVAVAPANTRFGEIYTVASDEGTDVVATNLSERGTVNIEAGEGGLGVTNQGAGSDFNPERIQIQADNDLTPGGTAGVPAVDTGARLADVTGVVSYGFGNFEVLATERITVAQESTLERETTTLAGAEDRLLVASYNVLNLDPNDADGNADVVEGQFQAIARDIAVNLNSPDVVALQEIQDNDGSANTAVTSASETLQRLVDALLAETGIRYEYIDNPFITDDRSGGEPGGNIRTAFLYNPERVDFVEGSLATAVDPADQATNPDNPFFGSRLPLSATFEFDDEEVTLVNNHFSSKGGSSPLSGTTQPSVNGSEDQRAAQAQAVNDYVDSLLAQDADARVAVLGDLNEFEFEEPLQILEGDLAFDGTGVVEADDVVLTNLTFELAPDERYSYVFEGNSQSLDHILVTDALRDGVQFDAVHINSEFVVGASDHDPLVASLLITDEDDERLAGRNGNDRLDGRGGDDTVLGGNGDDMLAGGADDDTVRGDNGNDLLFGDAMENPQGGPDSGNDLLEGGNGDDMLMAGAGDDRLDGGRGDDVLAGGEGRDVFLFVGRGWGRDRIADFVSGEDVIDLGGTGASFAGLDTNGDGRVGAGDRGVALEDGLVLRLQGGVVEVAGVTSLGQADLLLLG